MGTQKESAMSNLQYSADILEDILFRAGEAIDGTSDFDAAALRYLNRAYMAICAGGVELDPEIDEVWWWLQSTQPTSLILQPAVTTGTVSCTQNSATATLTAAPASSAIGWHFKTDNDADVYRVTNQVGTTLTLDSVFTGTTGAGKAYRLMQIDYSISASVLKIVSPMQTTRGNDYIIEGVDRDALARDWPLAQISSGTPSRFAMLSETTLRFNCYADTLMRVMYDYIQRPTLLTDSPTEEPIIPQEYRHVLSDYALFFILADKEDTKAEGMGMMAKSGLQAMAAEHRRRQVRFGNNFGKINPRQDLMQKSRGPLRTTSGLIIG